MHAGEGINMEAMNEYDGADFGLRGDEEGLAEDIDSDADESKESSIFDVEELDEQTWPKIKANNPSITSLSVKLFGSSFALGHNVDWENEGRYIGSNTNVKKMLIYGGYDSGVQGALKTNVTAFIEGLADNGSIEHLILYKWGSANGDALALLLPFFANNSSLRRLEFCLWHEGYRSWVGDWGENMRAKALHPRAIDNVIASALSQSNKSSLAYLNLNCNNSSEISDEWGSNIITYCAQWSSESDETRFRVKWYWRKWVCCASKLVPKPSLQNKGPQSCPQQHY